MTVSHFATPRLQPTVNLKAITPELLAVAIQKDDLNDALFPLMQEAGIDSGDVAARLFCGPKEECWPTATEATRRQLLAEWMEIEAVYARDESIEEDPEPATDPAAKLGLDTEQPKEFDVKIWLKVTDADRLRVAAIARAAAEGRSDDTFLDAEGGVDVAACLVMLFDPGVSPDGCEIQSTCAGEADPNFI